MRIGIGYDSHRLVTGRKLILGGVEIPHDRGLQGHSDGDAVAHAVADALLGAAALGDIGTHFPPDADEWRDADSIDLLQRAYQKLEEHGYQVVNVDVTIVTEAPRIAPYVTAMRQRLAAALGIGPTHVSVKAKTNEGMGWIGQREGIAALAAVLVSMVEG